MTAILKGKDRVRNRNAGHEKNNGDRHGNSSQLSKSDSYNLPTLTPSFSNDSLPLSTIEVRGNGNHKKSHHRIPNDVERLKRRKSTNHNSKLKPLLNLAESNNRRQNLSPKDNRSLFTRQLQILAFISATSFVLFLFFFLPTAAFIALVVGVISMLMLCSTAYNYAMFLLDQDQGDGALFDFLPASVQEYLCNTSMHEAMTNENGYAGQMRIKSVESGESMIHDAMAKIAQFARVK